MSGAAPRVHWSAWVGLGYMFVALVLILNQVLIGQGLMLGESLARADGMKPGALGLTLGAWLGLATLTFAASRRSLTAPQWAVIAAVGAWIGATAVSMSLHGQLQDARFWGVAGIAVGVAAGASLVPPELMRRAFWGLGWFFGWGSVIAGLGGVLFGLTGVVADESPRYARWLSMVGIDVDSFATLNGLTPGRVYVGLTCSILLVYAVRTLLPLPKRWWHFVMPLGLMLAIGWSFSRTGMVATVIGLGAALVPVQRFRAGIATAWTFVAVMAVVLLPMSTSALLARTPITDGTTTWRFALWQDYLNDPGNWTPFGNGPKAASWDWADHAHHQVLEAVATGGWLGLVGLLAFMWLACWVAVRVANSDNRGLFGVVFVMAAIFQVDVVTYSARYAVMNNALILLVAIVASNAGRVAPSTAVETERAESPQLV